MEEQFSIHEEYLALLMCDKENDPPKRIGLPACSMSITRLRSLDFPEPTTVSDVEANDSEVDVVKPKKGRRPSSSPSNAA